MSFYIKVEDVFYHLDATTDIRVTWSSKLSKNPTQSRKTASDSFINDEPTCTISGIITSIKSPNGRSQKTFSEYLDGLLTARLNKIPLDLKYRLDREEDPDWFITSFSTSQNKENGYGGVNSTTGEIVQSAKISMTLSKANLSRGVTASIEYDERFSDMLSSKSSGSASPPAYDDSVVDVDRSEELKASMTEAFANSKRLGLIARDGVIVDDTE